MSARYGNRYPRTSGGGSRWMDLRYTGTCKVCGATLPAGARAYWDASAGTATCWFLACCEADGLTTRECRGPAGWVTERQPRRVGAGVVVTRLNSGATTYRNARGRCEDAPCCGCCN